MRVDELDYELPEELIAQTPLPERDAARLLVLDRPSGRVTHSSIRSLPALLPPCLFVLNDTKVIPARLHGHKPTGGKVELLLINRLSEPAAVERWVALGRASKGLKPGTEVTMAGGVLRAVVEERRQGGDVVVRLEAQGTVRDALARVGEVPLPPYIRRAPAPDDVERYQTVFAQHEGAVAAPTAGLHLTSRLMDALREVGHRFAQVTLHVGPGTFAPVKVDDLREHPMHSERYDVSEEAARCIVDARAEGRPVVAIGTTVVRTLEASAQATGQVRPGSGSTDLFISPPFRPRVIDALLTNFHLPRSTLLALVMALGGQEQVRAAYREAVRDRYRFFSYGDAMLIRPA